MSVTRQARRHWLLLVALAALVVAAVAAFWPGDIEAHWTGAYHWHFYRDWLGNWCRDLYYPSGGYTGITQCDSWIGAK